MGVGEGGSPCLSDCGSENWMGPDAAAGNSLAILMSPDLPHPCLRLPSSQEEAAASLRDAAAIASAASARAAASLQAMEARALSSERKAEGSEQRASSAEASLAQARKELKSAQASISAGLAREREAEAAKAGLHQARSALASRVSELEAAEAALSAEVARATKEKVDTLLLLAQEVGREGAAARRSDVGWEFWKNATLSFALPAHRKTPAHAVIFAHRRRSATSTSARHWQP